MQAGIIRAGQDTSAGTHSGFPPTKTTTGSSTTFVDGFGVFRQNDSYLPHCNNTGCHPLTAAQGSPSKFVDGLPVHCQGHRTSCGDTAGFGSTTVFAEK